MGVPLYLSYYWSLLEWFYLAPLQLSLNCYKLAVTLYIPNTDIGFDPPTMVELIYFFSVRPNDLGYYYMVVWKLYFGKGFSEGSISNTRGWKETYFYVYDVPRVRTQFNIMPSKIWHTFCWP